MNGFSRWLSLGIVLILGFLLGVSGFSTWNKISSPLEPVAWSSEAQWIASQEPSYRFYARHTFDIPDAAQAGWLRLSADNDFILYVNGLKVTREINAAHNSLGLANGLSDPSQNLNDSVAYRFIGPEWIHISNPKNWKLTVYVDLASYLQPGKNVIALEIQKGRKNPRFVVQGAVYPVSAAPPIDLTTGATPWQAATLFQTHHGLFWFDPNFPDQNWSEAKTIGPVREATYSRLSPQLFDRFLQGNWITGIESPQGEVWLTSDWLIPENHQRAFIRFAGDGEFALLINGLLVKRYEVNDSNQLHIYEVTNFLKPGHNTLAVRLARPLDPDWFPTQHGYLTKNGLLGFLLDGWVQTNEGDIIAPIATDSTWSALRHPVAGWARSSGQGQPATILGLPDPQEVQRQFEGDAYLLNYPDYLWHISLWCLAGMGSTLVYAWGLGQFWLGRRHHWWDSLGAGAGLLLPGTLFLIGIGLLKHRYAEVERGLLFFQPHSTPLVLLGFVGITLLTLLSSQIKGCSSTLNASLRCGLWFLVGLVAFVGLAVAMTGVTFSLSRFIFLAFLSLAGITGLILYYHHLQSSFRGWQKTLSEIWALWGHWFLLVLIVGVGFGLRVYHLDFIALEADENTSLDAARGILRTGAPEASSGVWYTRGPAYHYMLALWLRLVGDSELNARFLSVLWGTATLVLIFLFTRKITKKVGVALIVTAILAIDPLEIWYSQFIRFYQVLQFLTILSFWLFFKGFIERKGRSYQYVFFLVIALAMITQELSIILLPCFLIGFLFFYRSFRLAYDWPIILSSFTSIGIYAYDIIFCSIKSLTPLVALSSSADALIQLHLLNITEFIALIFVGPTRMFVIYSLFFTMGFIYFLRHKDKDIVYIFSSLLVNLVLLTILIPQSAIRYIYSMYPLFIFLSVYSATYLMKSLEKTIEHITNKLLPIRNLPLVFLTLLLLSNIEPDRLLTGYQDAIIVRNTQAAAYIREHRQPGDLVFSNVPAISTTLGKLDYFIPHRLSIFDALYWHEGQVVDRWSGGVFLDNLDQLSHVLEKAKRIWIHLQDRQPPGDPKLAEFHKHISTLGQPALETFGTRVRLWQPEDGILPHVPNEGRDLGNY